MLYRVDQDVKIPTHTVRYNENNLTLVQNQHNKTAEMNLWLNSFDKSRAITNEEFVDRIIELLKKNQITQIDHISNFFKVSVDYSLYDRNNRELEHSISVYPFRPVDAIIPLEIGTENTLPYRFVKTFEKVIDFRFKDRMPFGIMTNKEDTYYFKIHDIRVMQDLDPMYEEHNSIDGQGYSRRSHTVKSYIDNTIVVYSSKESGIDFNKCYLSFIPRVVTFHMEILLDNFFVTYSDTIFDRILTENISIVHHIDEEIIREDPDHPAPPFIDQKEFLGKRGKFVVAEPRKPDSFLVVEDLYPRSAFDSKLMVRKRDVISDIPSISVGDYVRFIEDIIEDDTELYDNDHPFIPKDQSMHYENRDYIAGEIPDDGRRLPPWLRE